MIIELCEVNIRKAHHDYSLLINPEILSNIPKRKEVFTAEKKNKSEFEWVKVRAYPKLIDGKWAFETLYKKVYH